MSVEDHTVSFSLQVNVEDAYGNIRRLQTVLYRALGLFRRLGLPEPIDAAIGKIQRFISIMNQARLTILAFQAALAKTPFGWALFALSAITTAMDAGDLLMDLG